MQGQVDNCITNIGCVATYCLLITASVYADGDHTSDGDAD